MAVLNNHTTLYFSYGSNLWIDQMNRRCPESKLVGIGSLKDWKWIINTRGYANVIPSPGDTVYGLVYELSTADEASLDRSEGVPIAYVKEHMSIQLTLLTPSTASDSNSAFKHQPVESETREALVYIDFKRVTESVPKTEYIYRINMGIEDSSKQGIPGDYFEKYFRPFIPPLPESATENPSDIIDPFSPQLHPTELAKRVQASVPA